MLSDMAFACIDFGLRGGESICDSRHIQLGVNKGGGLALFKLAWCRLAKPTLISPASKFNLKSSRSCQRRQSLFDKPLSPVAIMATELTVQSERAFQKQPHIFLNHKTKAKSNRIGKGGRRWYKDVGLGFRTPKTAIEGTYIGRE